MALIDIRPPTLGNRRLFASRRFTVATVLGWMLVLTVMIFAVAMLQNLIETKLRPEPPMSDMLAVATAAFSLTVYIGLVRFGEQRGADELGWRNGGWRELALGLAIGFGLFAIVAGLLAALGAYRVSFQVRGPMWGLVSGLVGPPIREELLFRAIVLRLLWRAFGPWSALTLSSVLFGVLHLMNPNASFATAITIAIEAGILLASFYALTGRLWMSIGVHAAWNVTESWIFGAPVSGLSVTHGFGLMTLVPGTPLLLSGGAFGPEASLLALLVDGACGALVLWWAWRAGNLNVRLKADA